VEATFIITEIEFSVDMMRTAPHVKLTMRQIIEAGQFAMSGAIQLYAPLSRARAIEIAMQSQQEFTVTITSKNHDATLGPDFLALPPGQPSLEAK
jgi:hypothetical protein